MRQTLSPRNRSDSQSHEDHLGQARPGIGPAVQRRDQSRHGDVKKTTRGQGQRIRQRAEGTLQAEVRRYSPEDRGQSRGHVHEKGPAPGHARMDENREVPDTVRDLVGGHGKGRHQPEWEAGQEGGRDQHAIQGVVDAVADDDKDTRRARAVVVRLSVVRVLRVRVATMRVPRVSMSAMLMALVRVATMIVITVVVTCMRVAAPIRVRVPPEHELLNDKEDSQAHEQCRAHSVRAFRSNTFDRLRQERQERRA